MKTSLPVLLLILGLATYGSASFLEDLLGFDCIERGGSCNTINRPCCGEDQCYFKGGYHPRSANKGECKECFAKNVECQRDEQCCGHDPESSNPEVLCQKEHPFHVNGKCAALYEAGVECYKDSQCTSDDCAKPRFWHMYGKCEPRQP